MASHERSATESDTDASTHPVPAAAMPDLTPVVTTRGGEVEIVNGKPIFKPTKEFFLAFLALCTLSLAFAFEATSLSVALPTMSTSLGGSALEAFWSGTSFLLASTIVQPTVAAMSNIFGRKYMIYVAAVFFAGGSLIGGLAGNFTVLLVGRTIQGMGGGSLIALTEVVVTDLVPLAFRGQWFSLLSAMWAIGTVTGPLIGAGFAQNVTWRWIFYVNLPITGLGLIFVILFLNQAKIPGQIVQKLGRFDWLGSFHFTSSATGFLFGLSTGGVMYEWSSWRVILALVLGVLGMVAFAVYEFNWAKEPIMNPGLFNNRDMVLTYIVSIMHGAILWALLYFLILYYQGVKFYSPITSSVACLPETLTVAPAGAVVGIIAGVTGHYRVSLWTGWVLTTMGLGLLMLMKPETTVVQWVFLNLPVGIGTGMLFPAMALSIQAACEPRLNGQAAAFFSFLRTFGQSIGVAISGVIFQNAFRQRLLEIPAFASKADEFSRDATSMVDVIKSMPDGSPEKDELVLAYSDSLRVIYIALLAFSAFSLVLSVFVKGYSLQQEHVTDQGLVKADQSKIEKEKHPEAGLL